MDLDYHYTCERCGYSPTRIIECTFLQKIRARGLFSVNENKCTHPNAPEQYMKGMSGKCILSQCPAILERKEKLH